MKTIFNKSTEQFSLSAAVSPDNMKLFLDVVPTAAQQITQKELMDIIAEFIPTEKINAGVLEDIAQHVSKGEPVKERRIAKGQEPEPGTDGKLLYLVKRFTGEQEVKTDQKGFASRSDLHLFDNIHQGTLVARIYPPKRGQDGMDVFGKAVPSEPGKPIKISVDKSITIKPPQPGESYETLISESEGFLVEASGALAVKDEFIIKESLDLHYGNIDFIGAVIVKGDIVPGMHVKAKKAIEVAGNVTRATLTCTAGNISIKNFIFGGEASRVVCFGSFSAAVAQSLSVEAGGEILIHKEALDCSFRTPTAVLMPKGKLIGGETFVVCGVEAKSIGTDAGKETVLNLCGDIEMSSEYARLVVSIESHEHALKLLQLHLGPYAVNTAKIATLRPPFRGKMEKLLTKFKEVDISRLNLLEQKAKMLENRKSRDIIRVNFHEKMYGGVILRAGEDVFRVNETIQGPKSIDYKSAERKFEVGDLKPLDTSEQPSSKKEKEHGNKTTE